MENTDPGEVFSIANFSKAANVSRPFLYKMWSQGKGPKSIKIGRRRMIMEAPSVWLLRIGNDAA